MNRSTIFAVARKDFMDALRNARLLVIILMPIGFSLLYGYLFRDTPDSMEIVLYSPTQSALGVHLEQLVNVSLYLAESEEDLEAILEREKAALGIILPPNFDHALQAGEQPRVELIFRERAAESAGVQRLVRQMIEELSGRPPAARVVSRSLREQEGVGEPEQEEPIFGFFQGLNLQSYFIVLWVMMAVTMNGSFLVPTLLVEEKEKKTLDAILVTPAGYLDVVIGKLLVGVDYSLISATLIMVLNGGFVGDPEYSIAIVMLVSLAMTLVGLLIGGLINSMSTLNTWGGFILLPLMLPGILAGVPLGGLGPWLSVPLQAMPTFQLVRGFALALSGEGERVWPSILILSIECAILLGAVLWSLRRRES